jgi:hypothetical protein
LAKTGEVVPNPHLLERLEAVQRSLLALYGGGRPMSPATKGRERETFIHEFLEKAMPPIYRFGSGDIIDSAGQRTGQIDIVIEYPLLPSLPQVAGKERLYFAESVAAVIEVKSDLCSQWEEVERTARAVKSLRRPLRRDINPSIPPGQGYWDPIPVYAVGYMGWSRLETLANHLTIEGVNSALVIDKGLFAATWILPRQGAGSELHGVHYSMNNVQGPMALWGLISSLQEVTSGYFNNGQWLLDYIR